MSHKQYDFEDSIMSNNVASAIDRNKDVSVCKRLPNMNKLELKIFDPKVFF